MKVCIIGACASVGLEAAINATIDSSHEIIDGTDNIFIDNYALAMRASYSFMAMRIVHKLLKFVLTRKKI